MIKIGRLFQMVIAFGYYLYCTSRGKYWYQLYRKSQLEPRSFLGKCAITLFESSFKWGFLGYDYSKSNEERDSVSSFMVERYSLPSLQGYGDLDSAIASRQPNEVLIKTLNSILENMTKNSIVVEVGTALGNNIADLSDKYPDNKFIGIDFNVDNALKAHKPRKNLQFLSGYALQILKNKEISGDVLFSMSTAALVLPNELKNYIRAAKNAGFLYIVFCEPVFYREQVDENTEAISVHQNIGVWYHNYAAYLRDEGYKILSLTEHLYRPGDPKDIYFWSTIGTLKN